MRDQPVIVHCYTEESALAEVDHTQTEDPLKSLGDFCRRMGRETEQGEVGLIVQDNYIAFTDFTE